MKKGFDMPLIRAWNESALHLPSKSPPSKQNPPNPMHTSFICIKPYQLPRPSANLH